MKRRTFIKGLGILLAGVSFGKIPQSFPAADPVPPAPVRANEWTFAAGDELVRKAWAKQWWADAKRESYFNDEIKSIIRVK